jgi:dephospho-CoA kinase
MLKIGLTGNMGSGKSLVAELFRKLGIAVYSADLEARRILQQEEMKDRIRDLFGEAVFNGEQVDRKLLAGVVFGNEEKLGLLNALIHPLVRMDFIAWAGSREHEPYVILEAAILFESGFHEMCDKVILVRAPEEIMIRRVMARDGVTAEEVKRRLARQWPAGEKAKMADIVIDNDGTTLLLPRVLGIHETLFKQAG